MNDNWDAIAMSLDRQTYEDLYVNGHKGRYSNMSCLKEMTTDGKVHEGGNKVWLFIKRDEFDKARNLELKPCTAWETYVIFNKLEEEK